MRNVFAFRQLSCFQPTVSRVAANQRGTLQVLAGRRAVSDSLTLGAVLNIIIPAHRSPDTVGAVIEAISHETFPSGWTVRLVVCANGSRDETAAKAAEAAVTFCEVVEGSTYIVVATETPGEPQALNLMVDLIREPSSHQDEIIIGVNDDVIPSPGSIVALYSAMVDNPDMGAIGVVPRAAAYENSWVSTIAAATQAHIGETTIWGKLFAFRPSVIQGFREDLIAEDIYMMYRCAITAHPYGIISDERTYVYYFVPNRLRDVLRESMLHFRAALQFKREYGTLDFLGQHGTRKKAQSEFNLATRTLARLINRLAMLLVIMGETLRPSRTSLRTRIKTRIIY